MIRSVYIIGTQDNPVKVGVADDVNKRLISLQIGCPDELTLFHAVHVQDWAAALVEREVHQALAEHHRRGEWFNVSADHARATVERLAPLVFDRERERRRSSRDVFEQMSAEHNLSPWAADTLGHYKLVLTAPTGKREVEAMHSAIKEAVGVGGLVAFQTLMTNKPALDIALRRDPAGHRRALATLAQAINALVIFVREQAEQSLLDRILGNAA